MCSTISAFKTAQEAGNFAQQLQADGYDVVVSGPIDLIVVNQPGPTIGGWLENGQKWWVVLGAQQALTPA